MDSPDEDSRLIEAGCFGLGRSRNCHGRGRGSEHEKAEVMSKLDARAADVSSSKSQVSAGIDNVVSVLTAIKESL